MAEYALDGSQRVTIAGAEGGALDVTIVGGDSTVATPTQVAAVVDPVEILAANPARDGASVYYDGAATLYLLEGTGVPSATNYTLKMGFDYFTLYEAPAGFTGALQGIWTATAGAANVTERV